MFAVSDNGALSDVSLSFTGVVKLSLAEGYLQPHVSS